MHRERDAWWGRDERRGRVTRWGEGRARSAPGEGHTPREGCAAGEECTAGKGHALGEGHARSAPGEGHTPREVRAPGKGRAPREGCAPGEGCIITQPSGICVASPAL